jgi:hypothetical protein
MWYSFLQEIVNPWLYVIYLLFLPVVIPRFTTFIARRKFRRKTML